MYGYDKSRGSNTRRDIRAMQMFWAYINIMDPTTCKT
jgi:hypothetical protein